MFTCVDVTSALIQVLEREREMTDKNNESFMGAGWQRTFFNYKFQSSGSLSAFLLFKLVAVLMCLLFKLK